MAQDPLQHLMNNDRILRSLFQHLGVVSSGGLMNPNVRVTGDQTTFSSNAPPIFRLLQSAAGNTGQGVADPFSTFPGAFPGFPGLLGVSHYKLETVQQNLYLLFSLHD
jgi:hypothetical protein